MGLYVCRAVAKGMVVTEATHEIWGLGRGYPSAARWPGVVAYGTLQAATMALAVHGTHLCATTKSHLRRDASYGIRSGAAI